MILDDKQVKTKCQRFTPSEAVKEMLQMVNYNADNSCIIGKKVLENSFGNGNILVAIVEEYIEACKNEGFSTKEISDSLSLSIFGIELDTELYNVTRERLDTLTDNSRIPRVNWKLFNQDALSWDYDEKFDYIIGNPPYVTYSEIDVKTRDYLRVTFDTCGLGKFDYCYAFIESSLNRLSENGKLVQLIPNSIYKNVFADRLRSKIKDHIKQINIYPSQQLFKDVLTSTSIFAYDNECNTDTVLCINKTTNNKHLIPRESLRGKWILAENDRQDGDIKFGDLYKASSSIATLLNAAFILSENEAVVLEKEVIHSAASPKSLRNQKRESIIFPYTYSEEGKLTRYGEEEFTKEFPKTAAHLAKYKEELKKRATDSSCKWFEYGRSQALANINCEKLLMSTVITNRVEVYRIDANTIPYAGIYIIPVEKNADLNDALAILRSDGFLEYVKNIGIAINGISIRVTCGDINNYRFSRDEVI